MFDWGARNITFTKYWAQKYDVNEWGNWFGMFFKMFFTVFATYNTVNQCVAEFIQNNEIMDSWDDGELWESWQAEDVEVEVEEGEEGEENEDEGPTYNVGALIGYFCSSAIFAFQIYSTWESQYFYYDMGYSMGKLTT